MTFFDVKTTIELYAPTIDNVEANAATLTRKLTSPYSSGVNRTAMYNQNNAPTTFEIKSPDATLVRFLLDSTIFFIFSVILFI